MAEYNVANMTEAEIEERFREDYSKKMIRSGRLTTLVAAILTFLPPMYLWLGLGIKPT